MKLYAACNLTTRKCLFVSPDGLRKWDEPLNLPAEVLISASILEVTVPDSTCWTLETFMPAPQAMRWEVDPDTHMTYPVPMR